MDEAYKFLLGIGGLSATAGIDGVWLNFSTADGKHACINAWDMAGQEGFCKDVIRQWVKERMEQAGIER